MNLAKKPIKRSSNNRKAAEKEENKGIKCREHHQRNISILAGLNCTNIKCKSLKHTN